MVNKYLEELMNSHLFTGITLDELKTLMKMGNARLKEYKKGENISLIGEEINTISVVVEGEVLTYKDDYWGNRSILHTQKVGGVFGETFISPNSGTMQYNVMALKDSKLVVFDFLTDITKMTDHKVFNKVYRNIMYSLADKNRLLIKKVGYLMERSTRQKLLSYLSDEARRQHSPIFQIPYNRQQLADYLAVDRSAMSNELSKMRKEKILIYEKNKFTLIKKNHN